MKTHSIWLLSLAALVAINIPASSSGQMIRSGFGTNAASVQGSVDLFRMDLGTLNPNVSGSFGSGRREINWDGVPDIFAAPNNLPADFFNSNSPRGVVFSTPGSGFQVSANASNPTSTPVQFGNINPSYPGIFEPFSQQRLFTAIGSNIVDVSFFIPGSSTAALTTGFGSVFSDVDLASTSSLQFFDAANNSLGTFFVLNATGNETFSFLGVSFTNAIVSRVRITSGNQALGPNTTGDVVVMDDFIFGEPRLAPDCGSSALLLGLAFGVLVVVQGASNRRQQRIVG